MLVPTCLRPVAQRACAPRWQRLVSPERRLYIVTNEVELQSAVPEAPAGKARKALLGNLRQMLEWTRVGNSSGDINDRSERKKAGNWQPLGGVQWIKHDDAPEVVPLVGSSGHKYKSSVATASVATAFDACPNLRQVGGWRRAACHRSRGAAKRAAKKRDDVVAFANEMAAGQIYAAAADPKNLERGGRPYWLLRTLGKAVRLTSKRRAWAAPNAPTIPTKTWVVLAQWYLSTAADHHSKRQGYKLLDGHAYIRVSSIIQEHGLEFQHEGRNTTQEFASESTLKAESHARLQEHNFASYV